MRQCISSVDNRLPARGANTGRKSFVHKSVVFALAGAVFSLAGAARAQAPAGRLEVSGTSTLSDWKCSEAGMDAKLNNRPAPGASAQDTGTAASGLVLTFPVAAMDCGDGAVNGHMRDALKATQYPTISYRLTSVGISQALSVGQAPVRIAGELTIAGMTRSQPMTVTIAQRPDGSLSVQGAESLRMTDFGVKPPSLMVGLLKVRDLVHVAFDVVLRAGTVARLGLPPVGVPLPYGPRR
jgi:hypothetical protein